MREETREELLKRIENLEGALKRREDVLVEYERVQKILCVVDPTLEAKFEQARDIVRQLQP